MSTDEINRAIAEHLGWKNVHVFEDDAGRPIYCGTPPSPASYDAEIPRYAGDLNVMHEAEKALFDGSAELWTRYLEVELPDLARTTSVECSPARQRAEAALRTIGKWRDM